MGRDKATMPFDGSTMVELVVSALSARCSPVFVIAAPGQPLPDLQAEVLRDEVRGVGPLLATGRGLRAAADAGCERAFVCAVDMPHMTTELIDELAEHSARLGVDVVLPWDGRDHYLAGRVPHRRWPTAPTRWSRRGSAACVRWWRPSTRNGSSCRRNGR